ncbi:lipoprotein insertase outer membrane protein LolB [Frateuria aurantia]
MINFLVPAGVIPPRGQRAGAARIAWRAGLLAAALTLAGCHTMPLPRLHADHRLLVAQQAREARLSDWQDWTLHGRLGLSDGQHGGSGSFTWVQQGEHYDFEMRKPITGGLVFRLQGGPEGARLINGDGHELRDPDVESLMRKVMGWTVPLQELRAWVLGARASGSPANVSFQPDGLPASISQDGWQIDYPSWNPDRQPAMPRQVFASRPPYKVRLSIESWQQGPGGVAGAH